jgi:carboxyl-terminal processing protease
LGKKNMNLRRILPILLSLLLSACLPGRGEPTPTPTAQIIVEPTPNPYVEAFEAIWDTIDENYIYAEVLESDIAAIKDQYQIGILSLVSAEQYAPLVHEMLAELPEDTVNWQSRQERLELELASQEDTYEGIGAFVSYRADPEPHIILVEVIVGSPAEVAGLKDRDSIYAVDNVPITIEEGMDVIQRVRGPAGSDVLLSIESPGLGRRDVVVNRGRVIPQTKRLGIDFLEGTNILYAEFPRIAYPEMGVEFFASYQSLAQSGQIDGIIVDLRVSSGANWPLTQLLTMFTNGLVGNTLTREGSIPANIVGEDYFGSQEIPMVILIGPDTIGQAEMFAANMQVNNRAVVMGLPTLGLIEGFESYPIPDGSILSLAMATYVTADMRQIGITGVSPDIPIDAYWETLDPENDMVVEAALEYLLEQ